MSSNTAYVLLKSAKAQPRQTRERGLPGAVHLQLRVASPSGSLLAHTRCHMVLLFPRVLMFSIQTRALSLGMFQQHSQSQTVPLLMEMKPQGLHPAGWCIPPPTHTHCFGVELSAFWFPSGSYYLEADLNLECHTGTLHLSSLIDQWAVSSVCRSVAVHLPGRAHVPGPLPQTPPGKLSLPPERASGNAGRSSRLYQHDCVQVIISLQ